MTPPELFVIVQAGGQGTRLKHLAWNKPKCLVSVRGKPILYHLFGSFRTAKFIVIGDHNFDVLSNYLKINKPDIELQLIKTNQKGTLAGLDDALALIPEKAQVLICWSDLYLEDFRLPKTKEKPVIITTNSFPCRWKVNDQNVLEEHAASGAGVPGIFFISDVVDFPTLPKSGEFVSWWSENIRDFDTQNFDAVEDFGDLENIENANEAFGYCRYFNHIEVKSDVVIKKPIDPKFEEVHLNELKWYNEASDLGFKSIPKIFSSNPLTMARIDGKHPFEMPIDDPRSYSRALTDILSALEALHSTDKVGANIEDLRSVYVEKTLSRVQSVAELIPKFSRDVFSVNGVLCRNPFSEKYQELLNQLFPNLVVKTFHPIHGDPTFSNTLIENDGSVKFIDPRGYFAKPGIHGDKWYDFAKVYYSAVTGYDTFNRRKFKLNLISDGFEVHAHPNPLMSISKSVFSDAFPRELARIKILTGLIWLSLTGYARDDVDSVIGSFALGLLWLEQGLDAI